MSRGHRHTGVSHEHATPIERERAQRSEPPERSRAPGAPANERVGGAGPPSPRSGFGEVSPEPASGSPRAEADGAKPPGSEAHERSECATRAERGDGAPASERVGGAGGAKPPGVIFDEVSKFYGEVLGVNRVTLNIPPGITSLVGPNGSGKTTLMNLMTGLIFPDHGSILMRGISPRDPEALMRITGYATQYDTAPRWATGFTFITTGLLLFGYGRSAAEEKAWKALERLGLTEAANRKVAAYSKGMRQRVRLAQAIAHDPDLLVLDEPLNGLDPLVRAETIDMFRSWAAEGKHVIISSHVLQEVDLISDQVVLIANGMIVAEGKIRTVRDEIQEHPSQYIVRCRDGDASGVAALLFAEEHVTEIKLNDDRLGMLVMTRDREQFARALGRIALDGHRIESVVPADENVDALYEYLIGGER
jgi:ABC-2 type transport system ATP-binding protein